MQGELKALDELIVNARDDKDIPIYVFKYRIKTPESIYLKTKRKKITDLSTITDYAGLRVLTLFEKDLFEVNDFLLNNFKNRGYGLESLNVFNYHNDAHNMETITKIAAKYFPEVPVTPIPRKSGYKSIHYIITRELGSVQYKIEIQLRTLLQDVWGELEHSLSYKKGDIHPHIKKSFAILARDLENNDMLISHLRDISDRERSGEKFSNEKSGPRVYLNYEGDIVPEIFGGDVAADFQTYQSHMTSIRSFRDLAVKKDAFPAAEEAYKKVISKISAGLVDDDWRLFYWKNMEKAFLYFWQNKYSDAYDIYKMLLQKYPKMYCIHFRLGEIELLMGNIEKALAAFDESEAILSGLERVDHVNHYRIKTMLALTYWMLGEEYIDIAIHEISEAEKIYNLHEEVSSTNKAILLANNMAWYYLSKFIATQKMEDFEIAKLKYETLVKQVGEISESNVYDTCAWFCYHGYLFTKDSNYLKKAQEFCSRMGDKVNYTSFNFRSMNIHINHVQQIMSEKVTVHTK